MILKVDVLERAAEWGLPADQVEKDYVLGWMLAGLSRHVETQATWVFKGGTCLKKCYFETYRFSEDLDFSLLPAAKYSPDAIRRVLLDVCDDVSALSGIELPAEFVEVRDSFDKRQRTTFNARISYKGPLRIGSAQRHNLPRIQFDLTGHEKVFDAVVARSIHHPYPDELPDGTTVRCYSREEMLAEKTRALWERTRPRDLYDVVHIIERLAPALQLDRARAIFAEKCRSKDFEPPNRSDLEAMVRDAPELASTWQQMLRHQLAALPPLSSVLGRLRLEWLEEIAPIPALLPLLPPRVDEITVQSPRIEFWGGGAQLESIRFAGSNFLLVEFYYDGKHRLVEPYSIRRKKTGNLLLYAWEEDATHIKAFNIAKIENVRVTGHSFLPRYRVELVSAT